MLDLFRLPSHVEPRDAPCPSLGSSNPHNMRMTVDLPDPFGPRKPKIEPLATENET
jgi:hypothetical protein